MVPYKKHIKALLFKLFLFNVLYLDCLYRENVRLHMKIKNIPACTALSGSNNFQKLTLGKVDPGIP